MMAPRRVVTVLHAEALLAPRRESDAANRALDDLESLLQDPQPHATLVLVATSVDKRGRMYRILLKQATIVECGAIADAADAERWVRTTVSAGGAIIDQGAARFLVQRAGVDVGRLRGEVDRLLLYTLGAPRITVEDARIVGGPAALLDDWAMTNAIERGEAGVALKQLALMLDAGAPPEKILGQLGWLVRAKFPDIAPSALGDAVDALFRADLDLKRTAGDPRVLLERVVVELCEARAGAQVRSEQRAAW
jgi:DNA polymerase III delta subunit